MSLTLAPLHLTPRLVEKPWGGRRLGDLGRDLPPTLLIGESWDVADLDPSMTVTMDPVSRVATGPHAGATLADLIALDSAALLGQVPPTAEGRFPLLIKHLDAREDLSIQVHPPQSMAERDGVHLKTESWVVVATEPGARLLLGVDDGVTLDAVAAVFGTTALGGLLRSVPARVGDVHHLPAGLIHALGAGVVVAEIQTPSDTTYRMYDWTEEYGRRPRALHRIESLAAAGTDWSLNTDDRAPLVGDGLLIDTPWYRLSRGRTSSMPTTVHVGVRDAPRVVIVVSGSVRIDEEVGAAGCALLPAAWAGAMTVAPDSIWLDVDLVTGLVTV